MAKVSHKTVKDFRALDIAPLRKEVKEASKKLGQLQGELAVGKLTNVAALKRVKKDIARMKTVITEKVILKEIQG